MTPEVTEVPVTQPSAPSGNYYVVKNGTGAQLITQFPSSSQKFRQSEQSAFMTNADACSYQVIRFVQIAACVYMN